MTLPYSAFVMVTCMVVAVVVLELCHVISMLLSTACTDAGAVLCCRPTMILYGIDNIRDLFGHKVSKEVLLCAKLGLLLCPHMLQCTR